MARRLAYPDAVKQAAPIPVLLTAGPITAAVAATSGKINAIGVENEYADVISRSAASM